MNAAKPIVLACAMPKWNLGLEPIGDLTQWSHPALKVYGVIGRNFDIEKLFSRVNSRSSLNLCTGAHFDVSHLVHLTAE